MTTTPFNGIIVLEVFMFHILFIEDQKQIRQSLIKEAEAYNDKIIIHEAENIHTAKNIIQSHHIDVFFVDIQLGEDDGLEFAKKLRGIKEYQFTPIVFITGLIEKELEAYKDVHCYYFLLKPFTDCALNHLFEELLVDYLKPKELPKVMLEYKTHTQILTISDIIYVEYKNRKIYLTTKKDTISYKHIPLKKFQNQLHGYFIQVHQGYLVNRMYIDDININDNTIKMAYSDFFVPIGRSYKRNMEEIYHELL